MTTKKTIGAETTALCELLGRLDCVFWPSFAVDNRNRTVMFEWQQSWWAGVGLPLRTRSADERARKDAEVLWRNLEAAGLVAIARRKGRRSHVGFTLAGETLARGITATGDIFLWWQCFQAFVRLCDDVAEDTLPASLVAGLEPWEPTPEASDALYKLTGRLLPFATAGFVQFTLDTRDGLWVSLTSTGRQAIKYPPARPKGYSGWCLVGAASKAYEQAFSTARQELAIARPDRASNLILPRAPTGWGDYRRYLARRQELERRPARNLQEIPQ